LGPATTQLTADELMHRWNELCRRVASAGGDPDGVTVVAVTKGSDAAVVALARSVGMEHFGENYASELTAKAPAADGAHWHFLGSVQRNKVRRLAPHVWMWQGVDRAAAAEAIAARQPGARVLVQVNLTRDSHRGGCAELDAPGLVEHCRALSLDVRGLMGIGPAGDQVSSRNCFRGLSRLTRSLELPELSAGMSDDFEEAVAEGSTMIRIGRLLFGPRPGPGRARH